MLHSIHRMQSYMVLCLISVVSCQLNFMSFEVFEIFLDKFEFHFVHLDNLFWVLSFFIVI